MLNVRPMRIIKVNKANKAHIHKEIIEECGEPNIPYIITANVVLLYNPHVSLNALLEGIYILKKMVALRATKIDQERTN